MRKSGRRASNGSGPGAAANVPPPTPTTLSNLSSFFSSSYSRSTRLGTDSAGPATTGGLATFANGATFGDPFQQPRGAAASGLDVVHERDDSLGRKSSVDNFTSYTRTQQPLPPLPQQQQQQQQSPFTFKGLRRRANSSHSLRERDGTGAPPLGIDTYGFAHGGRPSIDPDPVVIDNGHPPALPDFALSSAAKLSQLSRDTEVFSSPSSTAKSSLDISRAYIQTLSNTRMLSRTGGTTPVNGFPPVGGMMAPPPPSGGPQGESFLVYQHIQEMANKRISTLEYLRKAHEGRVYWFNTLLFDKPDLARMPYFDSRRLARRATNYLLLGLSLPTVIDLNSATPLEFLRSLNLLLTEFDSFQQLHSETGGTSSTLSRARIPQMFRRATPSAKARRSSNANNEILYEGAESGPGAMNGASMSGTSSSVGGLTVGNGLGGSASVVSFGQCEADLLPGEEYVHLLTPSLPFDPDFFETFATLCDVLIDAYTRLLSLLPTPRECNAAVAELFTKADSRVRKILVQGVVKEFEDSSRGGVKTEVANVGKIVIGGLM